MIKPFMTLPMGCDQQVRGGTLPTRGGGAITRRRPSEGILGSRTPAQACTNVPSEVQVRPT